MINFKKINTRTGVGKVLSKCKVVQEFYRPTPSPELPCENRQMDINPYVDKNTTMVLKALKLQFADTDLFMYKDVDWLNVHLTEEQIRAAITSLISRAKKLYKARVGVYCLSDCLLDS